MAYVIALTGNPNSGKTSLFNQLTGDSQQIGNWPGVTVEKKQGILKNMPEIIVEDLPGIYSLSPFTPEEIITRNYLLKDKPDMILNVIDATNLERSLYLTLQLAEIGIPMIIALNMADKWEDDDIEKLCSTLSTELNLPVYPISSLKKTGLGVLIKALVQNLHTENSISSTFSFTKEIESFLQGLSGKIASFVQADKLRFFTLKVSEKDKLIYNSLLLKPELTQEILQYIDDFEYKQNSSLSALFAKERYGFIEEVLKKSQVYSEKNFYSFSSKVDNLFTHPVFALPIFALIMFLVYYIAVTTVGTFLTDYTNDTVFGEWILPGAKALLESLSVTPWISDFLINGVIGGVGAVLGFVPQLFVLFLLLALLEESGYMARIAFILDKLFRKLGLSGKSFIPMLIGTGCSVPGIMASRTIEQEKERRITIMTTSFIPCSAKIPFIALIAGALFENSWWVAGFAYFAGMGAVILSGLILNKSKIFQKQNSAFLMELPAYRLPTINHVFSSSGHKSWAFIQKAGTIILASSIILWFLQAFGFENNAFALVENNDNSFLAYIGRFIAPVFSPLGFGNWQAAVSTVTGLIAKENIVSSLGVLYGFAEITETGTEYWHLLAKDFTQLSALSFLLFNLLWAPCFAAIGAIKREMQSPKWTFIALGYICAFSYGFTFVFYQVGLLIQGNGFNFSSFLALLLVTLVVGFIFRKPQEEKGKIFPINTDYTPA